MRFLFKLLALTLAMVAAAGAVVGYQYRQFLHEPVLNAPRDLLLIERGDSALKVVRALDADRPDAHWQWRVLLALEPDLQHIHAGEYALPAGLKPVALLQFLRSANVKQHRFTIIEGTTVRELRRALAADQRLAQTLPGLAESALAQKLGIRGALEGWFLPETYVFVRGDSDLSVLKQAHAAMRAALVSAWSARPQDTPLKTPEDLLTLASIVEKETGHGPERNQIAGVFLRRLKLGMKLQTDPTVIYGLGTAFDGNLRKIDLQTPTPYNTYTEFGLPPTPIALPGRASIDAVIRPDDGNALYFVARGDGTSEFSATLAEHNRAVRRFQLGQ
jgi:UPF0755 protein